jgi:hypothetical protein
VLPGGFETSYITIEEYRSLIRPANVCRLIIGILIRLYFLTSRNKFVIQKVICLKLDVKAIL